MTKYTRREFFKSIIPISAGVVSFLGNDNPNESLKLDQSDLGNVRIGSAPTAYLNIQSDKETFFIPTYELYEDDTKMLLRQFFNQKKGAFYEILKDK